MVSRLSFLLLIVAFAPAAHGRSVPGSRCAVPNGLHQIRGQDLRTAIVGRQFSIAAGLGSWSFGADGHFLMIAHGPISQGGTYQIDRYYICTRTPNLMCLRLYRTLDGDMVAISLTPRDGRCVREPLLDLGAAK
jgi:hypothetical protein